LTSVDSGLNDQYLVVHVLGTGRRWADRSGAIIVASPGGGNRLNSGLLGLLTIFLKNFWLSSCRRGCRDEVLACATAD